MLNLSEKTVPKLEHLLVEKREALRKFRFGVAGSKSRDVKEGRNTRKEIARVLTELKTRNSKLQAPNNN
ncbi:MAG: 50S ribosomal protein L29 [Candidatus Taylorbacteria bacterium RIFCSPHIGHO2_02_FULL_44_36]|uniref:Large ribosomal subunit protein uL29 n=1 Tax=Candidatus Taylorbacteria bacterium RIFCSPLOWO2_12_FULL_44_15c TaxID=1802333 RepID=A0A1G2P6I1_9BACT|nr:MAG: 50S ribosomal protein L29 [Candidatus Taylorbacteria bacterium RIFCSPHIGHO2_02_FULL_44_36]OHA38599.1 MAG: 50S ribosomal protein L29 [Candidatus Taylorbacteria bacterium RIFCSPLOWO2_02_FULL_44_35]OHA43883.1 MAG: 50S ribosomal protein L29 [Candidatus Taylorbacteria bacterium RIFCSPLOWO2_12_FULL_44_15c]